MPEKIKVDTITRLKNLQPGEKFVYYKGDLNEDIEDSNGRYRTLLETIRRVASKLNDEGKVTLSKNKKHMKKGRKEVPYYEHIAIGLK